jgi:hypothetical protein
MADIAASDVTYTKQGGSAKASPADPRFSGVFKVEFGDGALTYPSGGVPLTKGKLGCPNVIHELTIMDDDDGSGLAFKYDHATGKIRIWNPGAAHVHNLLIKGGQAAAGTAALGHYATDILGKEAVTDATILGSASATKGGVITSAAAAGSEFSGAVAATTLYVRVVGY